MEEEKDTGMVPSKPAIDSDVMKKSLLVLAGLGSTWLVAKGLPASVVSPEVVLAVGAVVGKAVLIPIGAMIGRYFADERPIKGIIVPKGLVEKKDG